ncbi:MAG: hypothetical protein AVO33_01510 [delta proteobacterium ML8_F1]|nr:MAG: hypothetical protein AVO33_01510 [delta proteobacterium ML8_F1]
MNNLTVTLLGVTFENPLMPASGPIVGTLDNLRFFNDSKTGAVVTKTISVEGAQVAKPCIVASKHTVYNTELWSEKPLTEWTDHILPAFMALKKKPLLVSLGYTAADADILVPRLDEFADFFEVSTHYGKDELGPLVSSIVRHTDKPLFIKLSPHVTDYLGFIEEAVKFGAKGVVAVNSVGPGTVVDLKRRAVTLGLEGGKSWISGPAIKPIALNRVMNIRKNFPSLPIIATGGVASAEDVLEFILAGADLVQMLSAALINGRGVYDRIVDDLPRAMARYDIESIESLRLTPLNPLPQGPGGHPLVNHETCTQCLICVKVCPEEAMSLQSVITCDTTRCMQCGLCQSRCPVDAIEGVL